MRIRWIGIICSSCRSLVEADEGWIDARCLSLGLWLARFWTMSRAYDGGRGFGMYIGI